MLCQPYFVAGCFGFLVCGCLGFRDTVGLEQCVLVAKVAAGWGGARGYGPIAVARFELVKCDVARLFRIDTGAFPEYVACVFVLCEGWDVCGAQEEELGNAACATVAESVGDAGLGKGCGMSLAKVLLVSGQDLGFDFRWVNDGAKDRVFCLGIGVGIGRDLDHADAPGLDRAGRRDLAVEFFGSSITAELFLDGVRILGRIRQLTGKDLFFLVGFCQAFGGADDVAAVTLCSAESKIGGCKGCGQDNWFGKFVLAGSDGLAVVDAGLELTKETE